MGFFRRVFNAVVSVVNRVIDPVQKAIDDASSWLGERAKDIKDDVENVVKNIIDQVENIINKIAEEAERIGEQITDEVKRDLANLEDGIKSLGRKIDDILISNVTQEIKNDFDYLANILESVATNSTSAINGILQGDLSAVEDSLRQTGKDFEDSYKERLKEYDDQLHEIGRDFDDLVHEAVEPFVEALQYTRDEIVKPAWNATRNALEEAAKTIEDEVIKPAVDRAIAALDEVVEATTPEEFQEQYFRAKAAIDDAVDKIQESRDDIRESLKNIEDELKKAGHMIDDMKVQIMEMAAVIAIGFIPGIGPMLAMALQMALQAVFDEIHGRESLFDQLASGDFSNIDKVLIAAAATYLQVKGIDNLQEIKTATDAINAISKTLEVSEEVAKALEMAAKAYEIYRKVDQYKDIAEALIEGDLKQIAIEGLSLAGQEFAEFASYEVSGYLADVLPQIDLAKIITSKELIGAIIDGDLDAIKDQALGVLAAEASQYLNASLPDIAQNILNADDIANLLHGDTYFLEDKAQDFLEQKIGSYVQTIIPQNLSAILDKELIDQIVQGDFDAAIDKLKSVVTTEISVYIGVELPAEIRTLLSDEAIAALISGDTEILEDRLKDAFGAELVNQLSQFIDSEELLKAIKSIQLDNIKESALNIIGEKAQSYLEEVLPDSLNEIFLAQDVRGLIVKGKIPEFEAKAKSFLSENLSQYLKTVVPIDLQNIVSAAELQKVADGDFSGITDKLENLLSVKIGDFAQNNLPSKIAQFLGQQEIRALINGDSDLLKNKIIASLKEEIAQYQADLLNNSYIKAAAEFKDSIDQQIYNVQDYIDYAKDQAQQYQDFAEDYALEFEDGLENYVGVYQDQFELTKVEVENKFDEIQADFEDYSQFFAEEFRAEIAAKKAAIEDLLFDAADVLIEQYVEPILESEEQVQEELEDAFGNIADKYDAKVNQVSDIVEDLRLQVEGRIAEIKAIETAVTAQINIAQTDLEYLTAVTSNALSKEFYDKLQLFYTDIAAIETLAQNHLDEVQIIFNKENIADEISHLRQQAEQVGQNIINAKINSIASATITAVNTGATTILNSEYLKTIIASHVQASTQLQNYLDDAAIRAIVTDTASWLKATVNIVTGDGGNSVVSGDSRNFYGQLLTDYTSMKSDAGVNLIAGDYNGDGRADFIRQDKNGWDDDDYETAGIYLSKDDNSFSIQRLTDYVQMKGDLTNLIIGDYNGDGKDDFIRQEKGVWDDSDTTTAQIYLANGDGTFTSQLLTNYTIMKGDFNSLIVGDYNGDGKDDFIRQGRNNGVGNVSGISELYFANGDGTFRAHSMEYADGKNGDQTNLIVGDFNGDGKSDFIRQEKNSWDNDDLATAELYLSAGDGTFAISLLPDYNTMKGDETNLIIGDFNGDGKDDFIRQEKNNLDNDDTTTAQLYLSNGNGTFTSKLLTDYKTMKGDLTNLIIGDYNGDGKDDFIRQEKGSLDDDDTTTADVYFSNGSNGSFTRQAMTDFTWMKGDFTNLIVADYNGDGATDFIRQEKGSWDDDNTRTAELYLSDKGQADYIIDNVGNDIIYTGNGDDYAESGAGNDLIGGKAGNDYADGGDGDDTLYGDEGNDILKGGAGSDTLYADQGNDYAYGGDGNDTMYGDGRMLSQSAVGDGNDYLSGGNGNDVIRANGGNDQVFGDDGNDTLIGAFGTDTIYGGNGDDVIYGEGDPAGWMKDVDKIAQSDISIFYSGAIVAGDFNGDGKDDLFFKNSDGLNQFAYGKDDGSFQLATSQISQASLANLSNMLVGDFNGDGKDDLFFKNADGSNKIAYSNGDGSWQLSDNQIAQSDIAAFASGNVVSGDFNGDGKDDLFFKNADGSNKIVYSNGNGTWQIAINQIAQADLSNFTTGSVVVGDFNGDGKDDIFFQNSNGVKKVAYSNGAGSWDLVTNQISQNVQSTVVAGDFDGDGRDDLFSTTVSPPPGFFSIAAIQNSFVYNNGTSWSSGSVSILGNTDSGNIVSGDFNGDGQEEVFSKYQNNNIKIYIANDSFADLLDGGEGNDQIYGNGGSDVITGGKGNDSLSGEHGSDIYNFNFGDGNDVINDNSSSLLDKPTAIDVIKLGIGITKADLIFAKSGNDLTIGFKNNPTDAIKIQDHFNANLQNRIEQIQFVSGEDLDITIQNNLTNIFDNYLGDGSASSTLTGTSGKDYILGNDGNDTLIGGYGNDVLIGGSGNDVLWGEYDNDILNGGDGNDDLYGQVGDDVMQGGNGNDNLFGGESGNDTYIFNKGDGNDTFKDISHDGHDDAALNDVILLGSGLTRNDLILTRSGTDLRINFKNNSTDSIFVQHQFYYELNDSAHQYHRIESIKFADNSEVIDLTKLKFVINNNSPTWYGDAADNVLIGVSAADIFDAGSGNDQIYAGDGDDQILAGSGDDYIRGDAGIDYIDGGDGIDTLDYQDSNAAIDVRLDGTNVTGRSDTANKGWGGIANYDTILNIENLIGSNYADKILGNDFDNQLSGLDGNDSLSGGLGSDTYIFSNNFGNDTISDSDGLIVINGINLSGKASKQINDNEYLLQNYLLKMVGSDLLITNKQNPIGSITVANFQNDTFGINLDRSPTNTFTSLAVDEDVLTEFNLLAQASDLDGDILKVDSFTNASNGTLTVNRETGAAKYLADANFSGTDSFRYVVSDGRGGFVTRAVNITVSSVNDAPIAANDSFVTEENKSITLKFSDILVNDTDVEDEVEIKNLSFRNIIFSAPLHGTIVTTETDLIYTPDANYSGTDKISYQIKDSGNRLSSLATINVNVLPTFNPTKFAQSIGAKQAQIDQGFVYKLDSCSLISGVSNNDLTIVIKSSDGSDLPSWISFNRATLELTGTPSPELYGLQSFVIIASDGVTTTQSILNITVDKNLKAAIGANIIQVSSTMLLGEDEAHVSAVVDSKDLVIGSENDDVIQYSGDTTWSEAFMAYNPYSDDLVSLAGKQRSFDAFDGQGGSDSIKLTNFDDGLFLDDLFSGNPSQSGSRLFGVETISGGNGDDIIDLSSSEFTYGNVTLNGGNGDDILWSNDGDDILNGDLGNDHLVGGRGNDSMLGGDGNDILKGHDGDDILTGGSGSDTLIGGSGNDIFTFTSLGDSTINYSDLITDFTQGEDTINLSDLNFTSLTNDLTYHYDNTNNVTIIEDSTQSFVIKLTGNLELEESDFNFG